MIAPDDENGLAKVGFIEQSRNKELAKGLAARQEEVISKILAFSEKYPDRFEDMYTVPIKLYAGVRLNTGHNYGFNDTTGTSTSF
jgi:predicted Rossmann fold nucleotide-binding protein DprA/Smf involved in DNA uptake